MPRRRKRRAARSRERQLRVLRRRIRAGGCERHRAGHRDDVDHVRPPAGGDRRLEAGQERAGAPHAAEVVDAHHELDPLRVEREERAARRDAGVVDEQVDSRDVVRAPGPQPPRRPRGRPRRRPRPPRRSPPRRRGAGPLAGRRARSASHARRAAGRSPRRSPRKPRSRPPPRASAGRVGRRRLAHAGAP